MVCYIYLNWIWAKQTKVLPRQACRYKEMSRRHIPIWVKPLTRWLSTILPPGGGLVPQMSTSVWSWTWQMGFIKVSSTLTLLEENLRPQFYLLTVESNSTGPKIGSLVPPILWVISSSVFLFLPLAAHLLSLIKAASLTQDWFILATQGHLHSKFYQKRRSPWSPVCKLQSAKNKCKLLFL